MTGKTPEERIAETVVQTAMTACKAAAGSLVLLQQLIDSGQLHAEESERAYIRNVLTALLVSP